MAGLTAAGFTKKTAQEALDERLATMRSDFGVTNVGITLTKLATIEANREAVLWEQTEASFLQQDPNNAVGEGLVNAGNMVGVRRLAATRTENDPAVGSGGSTGTNGTIITAGSIVEDTDGNRHLIKADVTIVGGVASPDIESESFGPIPYTEGVAGTIITPITGWDTFTFPPVGSTVLGRLEETDEDYRVRREQSLSKVGGSQLDAMKARMLDEVDNITSVSIKENDEDFVVDGQAAHSLNFVVKGATNAEVGQKIWDVKGGSIKTVGAISQGVVDQQGNAQTVFFDRPTDVSMFVLIELVIDADFPEDQDIAKDDIKDAVKAFGEATFGIGDDVLHHKIIGAVDSSVPGINDPTVKLSRDAGPPTIENNIPIGETEQSDWDVANMTVTITGTV